MNKETYSIPQAPELEKKYRSKKAITKLARLVMGKSDVAAHPIEIRDDSSVPESVEVKAYTSETETKPMELEVLHNIMEGVAELDTKLHNGVSLKDAWYRAKHEANDPVYASLSEKNKATIGGAEVYADRYRNFEGFRQQIAIRDGEDLVFVSQGYERDFHDTQLKAQQYKLPVGYELSDGVISDIVFSRNSELENYKVASVEAHYIGEDSASTTDKGDALDTYEKLVAVQELIDKVAG